MRKEINNKTHIEISDAIIYRRSNFSNDLAKAFS